MNPNSVLQNSSHAPKLLEMTCDTLLLLNNDGYCKEMIVKTENNPYVNDQYTLLGKNVFEYFPEETVLELKPAIEYVVKTGKVSNANYNLPSLEKLYYFKCIIQKYDDEHVLCQYRDITQRSQMKKSLQITNERLRETERAAKIGYWIYHTGTKILRYSGYVGVLLNEDEDIAISLDDYLEQVYPEDREKVEQMLNQPDFDRRVELLTKGNGHHFSETWRDLDRSMCEFRVVKDKIYYLRLKIVNIHPLEDGNLIVDGYAQNIDDIISKWNELKMVTLAVNHSIDSVFATKMDGTLIFANNICRQQNQIDDEEEITKYKVYDILDNFHNEHHWNYFVQSLRANDNALKYTCNHPYPRFNIVSCECSSYVICNEYGEEIIWNHRRDKSEQVRYENRLKKAKERAEESDRLKSAFLSNMNHEIRTPLNAIVGFSALMADIDDAEERKKYYNIVESSNNRLLALIDEVLDLSKIESGTLDFNYTSVPLNDLCDEIVLTHQLYTKSSLISLELPEEEVIIKTDKNRLVQVISNLVNNASKFTKDGTITLGYRLRGSDAVEFFVKDTGIGIAKENLDKIFNRFVKVNSFAPGTGLGLSICKSIVERMGGDISVTSEEGVGSEFSFRLPLESGHFKEEELLQNPVYTPLVRTVREGKATILVAEDMDDNFELIKAMIGSEYHLLHAKDGKEAIEQFEATSPDLILIDVKMPGVSGMEAVNVIRKKSPTSPPIIAVSAYAHDKNRIQLLKSGCNDFLAKPLDKKTLLEAIHKYL